jgi:hypothetical protein
MVSLAQRLSISAVLSVGLSAGFMAWLNPPALAEDHISLQDGAECTGTFNGRDGQGLCLYERAPEGGSPYNYYDGEIVNGKPNGRGVLVYNNSDRYEGNFRNGLPSGQGMYLFANNDRYEGEFATGKFNGKGTFTYENGDSYSGDFRNGQPHGRGTFSFAEMAARYQGEFRYGQVNGNGVTFRDGIRCEGTFYDSTLSGEATCSYPRSSTVQSYVGEMRGGMAEGRGVRVWRNGRRFQGEFRSDVFIRNGEG